MFEIVTTPARVPASSLAASAAIHAATIAVLFTLGLSGVASKLPSRTLHFTLIAPAPDPAPVHKALPPLPPPPPAARVFRQLAAPVPQPKLILDPPPPPPVEIARVAVPQPSELPRVAPPPLKIGAFSEALPPAPLQAAAQSPLKTAGFATAETSALKPSRTPLISGAGFETASVSESKSPRSSATGLAGFGEASAPPSNASGRRPSSASPAAAFGDASIAAPNPHRSAAASTSGATPVEILDKPRPSYTEEARRLSLEGEVLLEVSFSASGQARVLRMLRGLGHGLDETAAAAAALIRFRPARRDGVPVDSIAAVHIVFQLAN